MIKLKIGCLQLQLMKSGNFELVKEKILSFKKDKCDIIVLSELCVGGPGSNNTEHYLNNYQDKFSEYLSDKENKKWKTITKAGNEFALKKFNNDTGVESVVELIKMLL